MIIRINLLSPETIKKEERSEFLLIAYLALIFVLGLCIVAGLFKWNQNRNLNNEISNLQAELAKYEDIVRQVDALEATKNVLEMKKNVISNLVSFRLIYPKFMEQLVDLMPPNMWQRSINTQLQTDGSVTVTLIGEAFDNYAIADFMSALMGSQDFSSVELGPVSSVNAGPAKASTSSFTLKFVYKKK